jgi:hypothetical protein
MKIILHMIRYNLDGSYRKAYHNKMRFWQITNEVIL